MNIKENMQGCVEILKEFEIISGNKYAELRRKVETEDKNAYAEISTLLEEVSSSIEEIVERGEGCKLNTYRS